jgi:hypothetical protein
MHSLIQWIPTRHDPVGGTVTWRQRLAADDGLTTAEYAVGTVAVAGLGGLLFKLLTSDAARDLIWGLFRSAFTSIVG